MVQITTIESRHPDVEVLFELNNTRTGPAYDGYRPAHMITDGCLTTGVHHYYNTNTLFPNKCAYGTITFIDPEAYPKTLWIGKKITIQEGEHIVGYATILKIYNKTLSTS